jgi:hypothetical protein
MSPKQLHGILTSLKGLIEANPEKGRAVLLENLPLAKALFQAQILLGMVNPEQKAEAVDVVAAQPVPSQAVDSVAPAGQSHMNGGAMSQGGQEDPHQLGAPHSQPWLVAFSQNDPAAADPAIHPLPCGNATVLAHRNKAVMVQR